MTTKPQIDDVCEAFHDFRTTCSRAFRHPVMSSEYTKTFEDAKKKLKEDLTKLGIAQHIDWTERN